MRDYRTALSGCWDPAFLPQSLPRLGNVADAFLFVGSAGSKADHLSQRHPDRTHIYMTSHKACPSQGLPQTALTHRPHLNIDGDRGDPFLWRPILLTPWPGPKSHATPAYFASKYTHSLHTRHRYCLCILPPAPRLQLAPGSMAVTCGPAPAASAKLSLAPVPPSRCFVKKHCSHWGGRE